ncbi:MAG: peptide-methionine (S)-S-oxide reductase MsrA [Myxococcota bacterium]
MRRLTYPRLPALEPSATGVGQFLLLVALLGFGAAMMACNDDRRAPASSSGEAAAAVAPTPAQLARTAVRPNVAPEHDVAILAGGCYWGMEEILRDVPGVIDTEVGFAGGDAATPDYDDVRGGDTGHAESIRVVFDPKRLSYAELLEKWFFRMHDPTTPNRQGNDVGTQYRSAIFYTSDDQKRVATEVKAKVDASGHWNKPIVTQVVPATPFTPAHAAHQDYLQKNPNGYTCHFMREFGG